jgi:predicted Rossmann fold nucleotide-binding protein DprA/Smf involved in DNA uptake
MARNKYIYLLSNATVVVSSGEKGGTWEGAKENLKKDWVPVLVSAHQQPLKAGNKALIDGSGLGKTKANALTVSPTFSPAQFSELLLMANETSPLQNETESLLSDSNSLQNETSSIADTSTNTRTNISAQDDLFSMQDNIDQETFFTEQAGDSRIVGDASGVENNDNQPELIHNISEIIEPQFNDMPDDSCQTTKSNENNALREAKVEVVEEECQAESSESIANKENTILTSMPELNEKQAQTQLHSTTPLLDNFYQQLCELIEKHPQKLISKSDLDAHFPEFAIMSTLALGKWLKHLIEQEKLVKTKSKQAQYTLPKGDEI